jgi:hypothetical protein
MHYCLVVNTRRYYSTLCEAQGERNGVSPPDASYVTGFNFPREQDEAHKNELASKAARLNASRLGRGSGGAGGQLHEDIVVRYLKYIFLCFTLYFIFPLCFLPIIPIISSFFLTTCRDVNSCT